MLRVAAYCRVSTDKGDQANSFAAQQRYFRERIQREPEWILQGIYADEGISGTSTQKRTAFNQMIRAAEAGEIDLIVTKEVSRFARNTVDTLDYTRRLRRQGVGVLFLSDNIDTRDSDGEFRLAIMSSVAQEESRKTSERSKWGQLRSMERGVVFGGPLLGYQVERGTMTVEPEGAEIVRLIFYKYVQEGKGSYTIARELREAGIRSSRGNCLWSPATVVKILKNEKYCGDLIQKKTYTPDHLTHKKRYNHGQEPVICLRDHHAPILEREIWEAAQRQLRSRPNGGGHGNRYPLSGKIRCGECGKNFVSRARKRKDGSTYRRWCCATVCGEGKQRIDGTGKIMGCNVGHHIRDELAIDLLRQAVGSVPVEREAVISILTRLVEDTLSANAQSERKRLEGELKKLKDRRAAIYDRLFDKTIDPDVFQTALLRCDTAIGKVNAELTRDRSEAEAPREFREAIRAIIAGGEQADERFYGRLLHHMTVYRDGRVEIALQGRAELWSGDLTTK